ncbi:hypothetical protein EDC01DRAFT_647231 [Geopyxis carbonaria]|nr:hypothetical protein EDC01DRAFT_647231 [Geopyxis carbonaria]
MSASLLLPRTLLQPLRLLRPLRPTPSGPQRLRLTPLRSFATKKPGQSTKRKPAFTSPPPPKAKPPPKPEPKYFSLAEQLGAAGKPTLLYACHPTAFIGFCYGISLGSIAYCVYLYKANIEHAPENLPGWVVKANWFAIVAMSAVAGTCWFYPTRIVQKIFAHPVPAVGNRPAGITLMLHRRPLVPLFPAKKIAVDNPHKLTLDAAFHGPNTPPPPAPVAAVAEEAPKQNVVLRVFKSVVNAPFNAFMGARRMITTQDFVLLMHQDGVGFQIHRDGWVWQRRGLDQLFGARKF